MMKNLYGHLSLCSILGVLQELSLLSLLLLLLLLILLFLLLLQLLLFLTQICTKSLVNMRAKFWENMMTGL